MQREITCNILFDTLLSTDYANVTLNVSLVGYFGEEFINGCLYKKFSEELAPEYRWWALALASVPLAGVLGNTLVCLAVWQERRLHNVTNFFLVSLALADLMVCLAVMPFGVIEQFYGYWPFDSFICTVWTTCDVLGCSASILHLCCISVGRYIGIRNPLRTRRHTRRGVLIRVAGVWCLAGLISCPIPILAINDVHNIQPAGDLCAINNRFFMVFGSLFAFYLPMIVMVVIYVLTVRELQKPPVVLSPLHAPFARTVHSDGTTKSNGHCPCIMAVRTARALNERRATKVLGVVFLLFVVCWAPFFVLNVLQTRLGPSFVPSYVFTGFLWLGYVSSTVNPLVYTVFNRTFRITFWELLLCRCGKRKRRSWNNHTMKGISKDNMMSWSFRSTTTYRAGGSTNSPPG